MKSVRLDFVRFAVEAIDRRSTEADLNGNGAIDANERGALGRLASVFDAIGLESVPVEVFVDQASALLAPALTSSVPDVYRGLFLDYELTLPTSLLAERVTALSQSESLALQLVDQLLRTIPESTPVDLTKLVDQTKAALSRAKIVEVGMPMVGLAGDFAKAFRIEYTASLGDGLMLTSPLYALVDKRGAVGTVASSDALI